jgi:hypothetical protein
MSFRGGAEFGRYLGIVDMWRFIEKVDRGQWMPAFTLWCDNQRTGLALPSEHQIAPLLGYSNGGGIGHRLRDSREH